MVPNPTANAFDDDDSDLASFDTPAPLFNPINQRKRAIDDGSVAIGLFSTKASKVGPIGVYSVVKPPYPRQTSSLLGSDALHFGSGESALSSVFPRTPRLIQDIDAPAVRFPEAVSRILEEIKKEGRDLTDLEVGELRGVLRMHIEMETKLVHKLLTEYKTCLTSGSLARVTDGLNLPSEPSTNGSAGYLAAYGVPVGASEPASSYGVPFASKPVAAKAKAALLDSDAVEPISSAGGVAFPPMQGGPGFMRPRGPRGFFPGPMMLPGPVRPPGGMAGPFAVIPAVRVVGANPRAGIPLNEENPVPVARRHLFDIRTIAHFIPPHLLGNIRDLNVNKGTSDSTRPDWRVKNIKGFITAKLLPDRINPMPFIALCRRYVPDAVMDEVLDDRLRHRLDGIALKMNLEKDYQLCMDGAIPQILPPMLMECKPIVKKVGAVGAQKSQSDGEGSKENADENEAGSGSEEKKESADGNASLVEKQDIVDKGDDGKAEA